MAVERAENPAASGAKSWLGDTFRRAGKSEVLINWRFRVSRKRWLDLHRTRNE